MNLYAFQLGREKELCLAELEALFGPALERNLDTAIFKLPEFGPDNPHFHSAKQLQDKLGGTIKIIKIIAEASSPEKLKPAIQSHLEENFEGISGKIPFSVSVLSVKNLKSINIKDLLNFSKKILKSLGVSSRFVNRPGENSRPATIYKARVIQKGIDLNIIRSNTPNLFYLGESISIQNLDSYTKRDFKKPKRDAKVGMLPPKLAQIMINLAELEHSTQEDNTLNSESSNPKNNTPNSPSTNPKTIFDPFCGTGTVLMEAMLMGKNAIGSDISPKLVDFSQANCAWLQKEFLERPQLQSAPVGSPQAPRPSIATNRTPTFRIFERDARFLNTQIVPEKIDAIVTEGYLGQPQSRIPNAQTRETIFRELANLHLNWLRAAAPITKRIVMCLTSYRTKKGSTNPKDIEHFPRFSEICQESGWKITKTLSYGRKDQFVLRDIVVLERV